MSLFWLIVIAGVLVTLWWLFVIAHHYHHNPWEGPKDDSKDT